MSENEYLDNEEGTDNLSQDEYQEDDSTLEDQEDYSEDSYESEEEPQKETFVQKLRRENRELKRQLKSGNKESNASPSDLEQIKKDLFLLKNPELAKDYDGIQATLKKHPTLTPEQAHAIYLTEKPKESVSKSEGFKG